MKEEEIVMIIAISNQKGGVGKTTTTHNLGVELAANNKRVLEVDADGQSSLTISFGKEPFDFEHSICEPRTSRYTRWI